MRIHGNRQHLARGSSSRLSHHIVSNSFVNIVYLHVMSLPLSKKKNESYDFLVPRICKSCQSSFSGKFCNVCGEKVIEPADKSFFNFLGNVFSEITSLDNKFLYTLRLMLLKTGYVSRQYMDGIRGRFFKPLSMFFVVNVIYFLFAWADTFNSQLKTQINYLPHSALAKSIVDQRLEKEKVIYEEFEKRYNEHSTDLAKLLHILFVVLMSMPIMILNFSRDRYFVDHFTASLEFNSAMILVVILAIPWALLGLGSLFPPASDVIFTILSDDVYTYIAAVSCGFLFYSIERRMYTQKVLSAILKSLVLVPCMLVVLQLYRALLFLVTVWTM